MMLSTHHSTQGLVLPFTPTATIALLIACVVLFILLLPGCKKPRLIANVPIVGTDGGQSLAQARERFVYDCKNMMLEGYRKVVYTLVTLQTPFLGSPLIVHSLKEVSSTFLAQWASV